MNGTLVPAYGRDYKSKKEALADWNAGKDFMLQSYSGGGLVSRSGAEEASLLSFQIRWKGLTMAAIIKAGKKVTDAEGNVTYGDWK